MMQRWELAQREMEAREPSAEELEQWEIDEMRRWDRELGGMSE